jgi:hypothetical protein
MWGFAEARGVSVQQLSGLLSPSDKIILGKKYHVLSWLKEGYAALIESENTMTAEELLENAKTLGWDTMARVLRLRDMGYGASLKSLLRRTHPKFKCLDNHGDDITLYCNSCNDELEMMEGPGKLSEEIQREFPEDFGLTELGAAQ